MTEPGRLTAAEAAEVLRRSAPIPLQRSGAPAVTCLEASDLDGRAAIVTLPAAHPVLLLFLSPTCLGCEDLFAAALSPSMLGLEEGEVLVVLRAMPEPAERVLVGASALVAPEAWGAYGVTGPPFFSLVLPASASVATEGVAWGAESVADAVRQALAGLEAPLVARLSPEDGR